MKTQVSYYFQFYLLSSLYGRAGSPFFIYEQLLASGHIEKAVHAPIGGFSMPSGMAIHHGIGDAKMHDTAQQLRIMFDQSATKFYKAVLFEGSDLLNHHKTILSVTSVSELDVKKMSSALLRAKGTFKNVEDNMRALQLEVNSLIESVRGRIRDLKNEINDKESKRKVMEQKIENMAQEVRENEIKSKNYENEAWKMASTARRMEKESEEAANWGTGQILGALGTLAIGYATGGLAYAVAPSVILGGFGMNNANKATEYRSRAERYADDASRYENKARELRNDIRHTRQSISQLQLDTMHIKHLMSQLESSLTKINAFSDSLHNSLGAMYQLTSMLQNMEVAVKNAEIDTESLQQRFKQLPHMFKNAESILKNTQSAWSTIQELLKMHSRFLT